ncbi:MAG TPA: aldo/keto reductase [Ktedonobacteraceae bacterium]|nr:aldo/keto reductase [Ktedonobacteraceae bacterium]
MTQVQQNRTLGASGIKVSPLGVGVWSWGEKAWGYGKGYGQEQVQEAYQTSLEAGLNFFDSAEIYGRGNSERLLGECVKADGRTVVIASKFAPLPNRFSPHTLMNALDASLDRLGVKTIDLYQVHWPFTFLSIDGLMDMMALAVNQGKIRAVGVSNYNAAQMRQAQQRLARYNIPLASNQVHYSLLHRKPEANGVLNACRDLNVALIAYSPLEQGLLTGKFRTTNAQIPPIDGPRRISRKFSHKARAEMEPLMNLLSEIGVARGKTINQVALNWLLCRDELIIPIPGAKNKRQVLENAGAMGWQLSDDEFTRIDAAAQPWKR